MRILLISDIHGNYPALQAIFDAFEQPFDLILNGGDTTVYGPFPNETISWLHSHQVPSILGNTDQTVIALLGGITFEHPRKAEKRIMYGWTAAELSAANRQWLVDQPETRVIELDGLAGKSKRTNTLGMYHGSPADPDEFLFPLTPACRFEELAAAVPHRIVTVGHSHVPFHRCIDTVHFINPGSVGRMFDGKPSASCAVLEIKRRDIEVSLHRVRYPVAAVVDELRRQRLPKIYEEMYLRGRKLN
jgi:predicted phosphodiesterase